MSKAVLSGGATARATTSLTGCGGLTKSVLSPTAPPSTNAIAASSPPPPASAVRGVIIATSLQHSHQVQQRGDCGCADAHAAAEHLPLRGVHALADRVGILVVVKDLEVSGGLLVAQRSLFFESVHALQEVGEIAVLLSHVQGYLSNRVLCRFLVQEDFAVKLRFLAAHLV